MKRFALLLLLTLSAATAEEYTETRELNLPFTGTLNAETVVGAITVKPWENDYVYLRARVTTHTFLDAQAVQIYTSADRVWAAAPAGISWGASFELSVPRAANLRVTTRVGAIAIADVAGTISAQTDVGAIELSGLAGDVDARTSVGAIAIVLTGARWEGKGLTATTATGAIRITAPRDYSAQFDLRTGIGGAVANFPGAPVLATGFLGREIAFTANGGGPAIHGTTAVGEIELLTASEQRP